MDKKDFNARCHSLDTEVGGAGRRLLVGWFGAYVLECAGYVRKWGFLCVGWRFSGRFDSSCQTTGIKLFFLFRYGKYSLIGNLLHLSDPSMDKVTIMLEGKEYAPTL